MRIFLFLLLLLSTNLTAVTISGFISDKKNGERLSFASVSLVGKNTGVVSNKEGYFVLNQVPLGSNELFVSSIGYNPKRIKQTVEKNQDVFLKIELERAAVAVEEFEVKTKKFEAEINSRDIKVGNIRQSTEDLQNIVQIGDADVFRAMQMLPGVTPISDFSSGLYVRGGTPDQNLILLDGIDVYNPNHFGGLFSTFNTDAIESVELLKGGYPALYGDRLSSVMDVSNLDGNRKNHQGIARLSLLSSSATLQGPWQMGETGGSYMGSFRRTYLDLMKSAIDGLPDYYFYDGHAKVNWDVTPLDKLQMSVYFGQDNLDLDFGMKIHTDWGNTTYSGQWLHVFNPRLFSHFIIAGSRYACNIYFKTDAEEKITRTNDIEDITLKTNFNYRPYDEHMIDFGLETKFNCLNFKVKAENSDISTANFPDISADNQIISAYVQDSWDITPLWTFQPGIRANVFHAKSANLPNSPTGNYFRVAPRLSLRYKTGTLSNVYASYGRYYQYLTSIGGDVSSPFDVWFPLDGSIKPGKSDHYIIGYKTQIREDWAFDTEIYYKTFRNLVEYNPETDYEWDNQTCNLANAVNIGKGRAWGADFMLRTNYAGLEGFIGYSFGVAKRTIDNVNLNPETLDPIEYYARYDRTHQINVVENFNISRSSGWQPWGGDIIISSSYTYGTGQPYLKPEEAFFDGEKIKFLYSYNDRFRLPNYSRLDLGLRYNFAFTKWTFEPYLQVINVLGTHNVYSRSYAASVNEEGDIHIDEYDSYQFPRIPFIGFDVSW